MNSPNMSVDSKIVPSQHARPLQPVLALVTDLFWITRLADAISQQDGQPVLASSREELRAGLERWPVLALIDIHALPAKEWQPEIRRAKLLPSLRPIPIIGFGSHLATAALRAARQAGCDAIWPRSRLARELPLLIAEHLHPPPVYLEGWDEPPPALVLEAVALFNAGRFYEQHDLLERAWMAESRPVRELYQGILQVGIALHHLKQDNYRGAVKMLRRGLLHLRRFPPVCQALDVDSLRRAARALHDEIISLGPDGVGQIAQQRLQQIRIEVVG